MDESLLFLCKDIFVTVRSYSNTIRREVSSEFPILVNHPCFQKLRHRVNQTRPADADGLRPSNGKDHRFISSRVDADLLNGSPVRPHSQFYPCSFKGRAGRAGDAGQPILISEDDLSIGADIHIKGEGLPLKNPGTQDPGT